MSREPIKLNIEMFVMYFYKFILDNCKRNPKTLLLDRKDFFQIY